MSRFGTPARLIIEKFNFTGIIFKLMSSKYTSPHVKPLSKRKIILQELCDQYPHYNFKSNLVGGLFLVGLILIIWEISIFRMTFISVYIPLSIWILSGIIIKPFFRKTLNIYCFNPASPGYIPTWLHYFYDIVSFGGIITFLFMWTNFHYPNQDKKAITASILSYGHLAKSKNSCGEPYINIKYKDFEKQLIFPCGTEVEKYGQVYIETKKGFWGFDIITNKTLIEGQW